MKNQRIIPLIGALIVLALVVTACNKGGSSPTATAKAFYDASKSKDVPGMKSQMSKKTLDTLDKALKAQNKSVDDFLKETNDKEPPSGTFEARNEKINGETATLEVSDGKGGWQPFSFIKEDGQWKLNILGGD